MGISGSADLCLCARNVVDAEELKRLALETVKAANMTPIGEVAATVTDGVNSGATAVIAVVPLKESHLAIHTWPELEYTSIDFYTCGDEQAGRRAFEKLCNWFGSMGSSEIRVSDRLAWVRRG